MIVFLIDQLPGLLLGIAIGGVGVLAAMILIDEHHDRKHPL